MQHPWQPISTAPRDSVIDVPADERLPFRIRMAQGIALLGWFDQAFVVLRGCWAMKDNVGEWWNLENEEPVDFDVIGWAPLPDEGAAEEMMRAAGFNPAIRL